MTQSFTFQLFRFCGTFPFTSRGASSTALFVYSLAVIFAIFTLFVIDVIFMFIPHSFGPDDWAIESCNIVEILAYLGIILAHASSLARNRNEFEQFWEASELKSVQYFEAAILMSSVITCINDSVVYYIEGRLNDVSWCLDLSIYVITMITIGLIQAQFIAAFEVLGAGLEATSRRIRRHIDVLKHSKLISMNTLAMEIYGWHLLFCVLLVAVCIVRMSYEIYSSLINHEKISLVCTLGNLLIKFAQLMIIVHVCESNNAKAQAFNNELFKLMRENDQLSKDNKLFLYVTMKQSVNFTACGFFNLGYPLVTSIIAAATTYLVILLQFSVP